ncbi:MAG: substrate-binding domain-containing protein [Eubacteriales bacterium]|jgi:ABC-type sugar transport system substrate-binding protein
MNLPIPRKRRLAYMLPLALVLLLLLFFLLWNDFSQVSTHSPLVGLVDSGIEQEWDSLMLENIRQDLEKHDISVHYFSGNCRQDIQIQAIRSLIRQKADCIVLFPLTPTGWKEILQEAHDAGIIIITIGRPVAYQEQPESLRSHIGVSQYKAAFQLGEFLAEQSNEPTTLIELTMGDLLPLSQERHQGLLDALGAQDLLQMEPVLMGGADENATKEILADRLESWLANDSLPDILLTHSGNLAIWTIQVLEEYGVTPGKDLQLVSFDAIPQTLRELQEGRISCLSATSYTYGPLVRTVLEELPADPLPYQQILQDTRVLTPEDIS